MTVSNSGGSGWGGGGGGGGARYDDYDDSRRRTINYYPSRTVGIYDDAWAYPYQYQYRYPNYYAATSLSYPWLSWQRPVVEEDVTTTSTSTSTVLRTGENRSPDRVPPATESPTLPLMVVLIMLAVAVSLGYVAYSVGRHSRT